jgi:hypothetical protein
VDQTEEQTQVVVWRIELLVTRHWMHLACPLSAKLSMAFATLNVHHSTMFSLAGCIRRGIWHMHRRDDSHHTGS